MLFWHGGNLNDYQHSIKHKGGRYEYGPGLYATTHYETAQKYSKGSRKLYLLDIAKGNELNNSTLSVELTNSFIQSNVIKTKRKEIVERLEKYNKNGQVPASNFVTILLNENALKPAKMNNLREFLVSNGIDYELVNSPFGWHETMIVLYNMNKITNIKQVLPKDKIKIYDLSTVSESENMQSIIACRTTKIARILHVSEQLKLTKHDKAITLYRGLEEKFNSSYDLSRTDAPNGYSTWTDNPKLAKQYAGKNGFVYKIELPASEMGESFIDTDGERSLFFKNEKSAGLSGISGNEYLIYHDHENYFSNLIKLTNY